MSDLREMTDEEKAASIKEFGELCAKNTLAFFKMLGLKTHIELMIIEENTKEEYVFSFKKLIDYKNDPSIEKMTQKYQDEQLDSFAVEFAEWIRENTSESIDKGYYWLDNSKHDARELLQIFKTKDL